MINLPPETFAELERLQTTITTYAGVVSRVGPEMIAKKAQDLRIQLYKGFADHRWQGSGKDPRNNKGIAFIEMRARAKLGRAIGNGVKIRTGLTTPAANAPTMAYRTVQGKAGSRRKLLVPTTERQRLVWTELARRQSGRRVLGVSFLMKRWRNVRDDQGNRIKVLKANVTARNELVMGEQIYEQRDFANKRVLGRITLRSNSATIEGFLGAHSTISNRYAILAGAMRAVREDIEVYLNRKLGGSTFSDCVDAAKST
jgi:hypothetical protein